MEMRTYELRKVADSQGFYEFKLENLQQGTYRFWLSSPRVLPRPEVECQVLGPPGEQDRLVMDRAEMEAAAAISTLMVRRKR
jgi:hypothetical protein